MPLEAIQLLGNGKCHGQVSGAFVGHPGVFGRGLRVFQDVDFCCNIVTQNIVVNTLTLWIRWVTVSKTYTTIFEQFLQQLQHFKFGHWNALCGGGR